MIEIDYEMLNTLEPAEYETYEVHYPSGELLDVTDTGDKALKIAQYWAKVRKEKLTVWRVLTQVTKTNTSTIEP